ncbi:MAG: DUF3224 domain-containing protein [Aeromicrobium sp.]
MSSELIARFNVVGWDPRELHGLDGDWVSGVTMTKVFTEGITGDSIALFVASGTEGQRSYFAAERITGALHDGRAGSFTVHHGGLESDESTWFGHIIPASGTNDFSDFAGSAHIQHDADGAYFVIKLNVIEPTT